MWRIWAAGIIENHAAGPILHYSSAPGAATAGNQEVGVKPNLCN